MIITSKEKDDRVENNDEIIKLYVFSIDTLFLTRVYIWVCSLEFCGVWQMALMCVMLHF